MNKHFRNTKNKLTKVSGRAKMAILSLTTGAMMFPATAHASEASGFNSYSGTSGNSIMNGIKNFYGTAGTWGGGFYAAGAIFALILAIRNEDNEGRNKAALNLVAAIALLSTGAIIKLFFTT